ncbi:MAG: bifunctional (p)ppGpp synthetase/guanosine-3',5'-bis(diphosphate) 3'-pyrophosphohydrolase [Candidatus Gracilibacteria bacterium]
MVTTLPFLIKTAQEYNPDLDVVRVQKAFALAEEAHHGQSRFSGDPYIFHLLETAKILLTLKPDEDTIIAALLHDIGDTETSMKTVEKQFGPKVTRLIQGVSKLSLIKMQSAEPQVETWRRMFLVMAKDLRVIFIKLADRLHNLRTLEFVPELKQKRIAEETLHVYAPIASRLGIYSIKSELEDLCFRFLYPKPFFALQKELMAHGKVHERYIEEAQEVLVNLLKKEGIPGEVSGRVKHLYSIHGKLKKSNKNSIYDIYDLFAIRIVLPDEEYDCYTTLGVIHNRWTPMPGRFKDYIAVPKLNGYRSLHTTVMGLLPSLPRQPIEIQIRTKSMHQESEFGIASHWWYEDSKRASTQIPRQEVEKLLQGRRLLNQLYELLSEFPEQRTELEYCLFRTGSEAKEGEARVRRLLEAHRFSVKDTEILFDFLKRSSPQDPRVKALQHQIDWLYGLQNLHAENGAKEGASSDIEVFQDRIFVLTPGGDVKDLPVGSTPVDFAYGVHTDVGNRCFQAKVNGHIVGLDYELKSGDMVDILTRKDPQPNRYWLSFVKTAMAKNKIKAWFKSMDHEKNIKAGRELINKELKRLNKPLLGPGYRLLEHYGGSGKVLPLVDREHIVETVGEGTLFPHTVVRGIFSEQELLGECLQRAPSHTPQVAGVVLGKEGVLITGEANVPITLSACCKPIFPQPIVGYVTRGKTIRVHRAGCYQLTTAPSERLLPASWTAHAGEVHYHVKIRIEAQDRIGVLRDVFEAIAGMGVNIVDFPLVSKEGGRVTRDLSVDILNYDRLAELLSKLERVDGVVSVKKQ